MWRRSWIGSIGAAGPRQTWAASPITVAIGQNRPHGIKKFRRENGKRRTPYPDGPLLCALCDSYFNSEKPGRMNSFQDFGVSRQRQMLPVKEYKC
jgi:hypothetical protein